MVSGGLITDPIAPAAIQLPDISSKSSLGTPNTLSISGGKLYITSGANLYVISGGANNLYFKVG